VARSKAELGEVTNLCNIAGIGGFAHTPEQSLSGWDKIIAVNLTGTFLMCRAVLPGMIEHGGAIVNTVSTAGVIGQPYSAAYCASKGGVKMLTKALAVEYMARGVRVNGVAPGGVDTPIIHNFGPPEDADWNLIQRLMTPIGFAYPHEIAGAFAYLGSHEADYVTGAILSIDGAIST
jgi:NAD(P)-dependent dehydrogenase (short-subunit alcohol dehydrogenase family)